MSTEDDEWEKAEERLLALKLVIWLLMLLLTCVTVCILQEAERNAPPSVVFPTRLVTRPVQNDINFFSDPIPAQPIPSSLYLPNLTMEEKIAQIDPILINGINNPAERMNVLNIENMIWKFAISRFGISYFAFC